MPVVRVSWFAGRSHEQKKTVAAEITESIARCAGIDPKWVYVIFEDVASSDWAVEGKLFEEPTSDSPGET